MNVLAGLAEGVVTAVLERDDPERDPFALALERYQRSGPPDDLCGEWRDVTTPHAGGGVGVLRKLGRDLLVDVLRYATSTTEVEPGEADEDSGSGSALAVIGGGVPLPALERGSDGSWHLAEPAATSDARRAADRTKAGVPSLASRYPDRY